MAAAEMADSIHATVRNFCLYSLWMTSLMRWISSRKPPPDLTLMTTTFTPSFSRSGMASLRGLAAICMPTISSAVRMAARGVSPGPGLGLASPLASGLVSGLVSSAGVAPSPARTILSMSPGFRNSSCEMPLVSWRSQT
jgi:hypothetical protein